MPASRPVSRAHGASLRPVFLTLLLAQLGCDGASSGPEPSEAPSALPTVGSEEPSGGGDVPAPSASPSPSAPGSGSGVSDGAGGSGAGGGGNTAAGGGPSNVGGAGGGPSAGGGTSAGGGPGAGGSAGGAGSPTSNGGTPGAGGTENTGNCPTNAENAFLEVLRIPGTLQAEDFDLQGYADDSPGNQGEAYRPDEDVDIRALPFVGQVVSWMNTGEWLEYTVDVEMAGRYRVLLRGAALEPGRTLELSSCGEVLAQFAIPTVPELDITDTVDAEVQLQAGLQVLRVSVGDMSELDFDRFSFELLERADGGPLPGWIGVPGEPGEIPRFVGNITTRNAVDTADLVYADYWDQITPENSGKWGSIQRTRTSAPDWTALDALYNYAMDNGLVFKQHAFVWGTQQPIGDITEEDVRGWMHAFCERYPRTHLIDVVNEPPPHTTPSYADAIGGGTNGNWQWITNAFIWAREACPNAVLILNDYNNIEWAADNQHFIDIVNTVLQNGGPIDAVGAQAHDLDEGSVSFATVSNLLQKLRNDTGLPVYISEMDISTPDDAAQLDMYQTYFSHFWNQDYVHGVTIWGWIYGRTWQAAPDSGLVRDGASRPAMTWLMGELGRPAP